MYKDIVRLLVIVAVLVLIGGSISAFAGRQTAVGLPGIRQDDLDRMSNAGTVVSAGPEMQAILVQTGTAGGIVHQLDQRVGMAFFRITESPRGTCYGVGLADNPQARLNQLECGTAFPSAGQPILDASVVERSAAGQLRVLQAQGWAADGVASVEVIDARDLVVAQAEVAQNIYAIDGTALRGVAGIKLIARDRMGSIVYTQPYE